MKTTSNEASKETTLPFTFPAWVNYEKGESVDFEITADLTDEEIARVISTI